MVACLCSGQDGFDDLDTIKLVTEEELRQLGIAKTGHRKRIMHWVEGQKETNESSVARDDAGNDGVPQKEEMKESTETDGSEIKEASESKEGNKSKKENKSANKEKQSKHASKEASKTSKDAKDAAPVLPPPVTASSDGDQGSPRSTAAGQARPNQPLTLSGSAFPTAAGAKKGMNAKSNLPDGTPLDLATTRHTS